MDIRNSSISGTSLSIVCLSDCKLTTIGRSLGVLLFEMCCGWSPFYAEDTQQMYKLM